MCPTSRGYKGYPRAICISVNDVVVHGIPGPLRIADGDLVTIDVGVTLDGSIADSAYTYAVGAVDERTQRLLDTCQEALWAGIEQARPGQPGRRHLARRPASWSRRLASRSCAASSVTAWAGTTTRTRTCRTSASPVAARGWRRG